MIQLADIEESKAAAGDWERKCSKEEPRCKSPPLLKWELVDSEMVGSWLRREFPWGSISVFRTAVIVQFGRYPNLTMNLSSDDARLYGDLYFEDIRRSLARFCGDLRPTAAEFHTAIEDGLYAFEVLT